MEAGLANKDYDDDADDDDDGDDDPALEGNPKIMISFWGPITGISNSSCLVELYMCNSSIWRNGLHCL